jgi:AraC family transcriptional regulator, regulatory protein of adaptative response / methylated-DNA-[protein]-cysteine methyltransferase
MAQYDTDASRWSAVQSKDFTSDGAFVYCVKTTKIYCRPTCKARLARRANVVFADNSEDAERAGFRPCKRCKPDLWNHDPHAEVVRRARLTITERIQARERIGLRELATEAGMTESHFHRVFKGVMGITPKDFAKSLASSLTNSSVPIIDSDATGGSKVRVSEEMGLVDMTSDMNDKDYPPDMTTAPGKLQPSTDQSHLIEFTIQPWSSFYVLVAVAYNSICAIDTADTYAELITEVQNRYLHCEIRLSDWSPGTIPKEDCHFLFASVMSALENPTGRIVNLSPGVLDMHSVIANCG